MAKKKAIPQSPITPDGEICIDLHKESLAAKLYSYASASHTDPDGIDHAELADALCSEADAATAACLKKIRHAAAAGEYQIEFDCSGVWDYSRMGHIGYCRGRDRVIEMVRQRIPLQSRVALRSSVELGDCRVNTTEYLVIIFDWSLTTVEQLGVR